MAKALPAVLLLFFCFLFPQPSFAKAREGVFHPVMTRLENGLQVVVVPNKISDAVLHMIWFKAGAADDPEGKSGLAHYLEHMMFNKDDKEQEGSFAAQVAARGGDVNAFTSYDQTAYYAIIGKEQLPFIMGLEAGRLRARPFDDARAASEKDVVLSERQERTEDGPLGLFYEKLSAAFWGDHVYGRPVIGWRRDIEGLTYGDLRAFYGKYYVPENAILIVSGDVDPVEVFRMAREAYGAIPSGAARDTVALPAAPTRAFREELVMRDARVRQPLALKMFLAPTYRDNEKEALALEVLAEALSGGEVGLLPRQFVMTQKAAGIDINYDPAPRGGTDFLVVLTPVPDGDTQKLMAEVNLYLQKLARRGLAAKEIDAAKQRLLDAAVFARDGLMNSVQVLGQMMTGGYNVDLVEEWPSRIESVSVKEVNTALRHLLAEQHQVTGYLLPKAEAAP